MHHYSVLLLLQPLILQFQLQELKHLHLRAASMLQTNNKLRLWWFIWWHCLQSYIIKSSTQWFCKCCNFDFWSPCAPAKKWLAKYAWSTNRSSNLCSSYSGSSTCYSESYNKTTTWICSSFWSLIIWICSCFYSANAISAQYVWWSTHTSWISITRT